jgi:hypothetical protein
MAISPPPNHEVWRVLFTTSEGVTKTYDFTEEASARNFYTRLATTGDRLVYVGLMQHDGWRTIESVRQ